jgi:hypothetical protein
MLLFIFSLFGFYSPPSGHLPSDLARMSKKGETSIAQYHSKDSFPASWFGSWSGTMESIQSSGKITRFPMSLEYHATDSPGVYQWNIIYGEDRIKGLRPYLLRTVNPSVGHYLHDEVNGILLDAFYIGETLFTSFQVANNRLTTMERVQGDTLYWELIFGNSNPIRSSQGSGENGENGTLVESFSIQSIQRAVLTRSNKKPKN